MVNNVNAQEWLDKEYPKNSRNNITEINIDVFELCKKGKLKEKEYLEYSLKIESFTSIKNFNCYNNEITNLEFIECPELEIIKCDYNGLYSLNIQNVPNLKKLNCSHNYLKKLDLSNNIKLEEIDLSDNDFQKQTLSFLSHLVNLEGLNLKNTRRGFHVCYNQFYGSLKPLGNLKKLEWINISDTDIDRGLEYLPPSISPRCEVDVRDDAKVKYLAKEAQAKKISQEKMKKGIRESLPHRNLTKKLSELIEEAKRVDTLEAYEELMQKMPFEDVRNSVGRGEDLNDSTHMYFWRLGNEIRELASLKNIEGNHERRSKVKNEIKEKIAELLSKANEVKNMTTHLESQLNELETTFEQQLKGQEDNWNEQIQTKKNKITFFYSKKSLSDHNEEIEELQNKVSDYKNLVSKLQLSRNIVNMNKMEEMIDNEGYLNDSLQELQKEDNEPAWEGFYQILEKAKARLARAEEVTKNVEKQITNELKIYIELAEELTQKLSDGKQLETKLSTLVDYEDTIVRKEKELERKKKMFDVYVEKGNEEKMEKTEEEITKLEEEISKLKLEQRQQQIAQIQVDPK